MKTSRTRSRTIEDQPGGSATETTEKVTPWVLTIGDRTCHYQLPGLTRWQVLSETPRQVRVQSSSGGKKNLWQHKCYCVASDREWLEVNNRLQAFQADLDHIAVYLRQLGSYNQRLTEAGGIKKAPNPLTPSVICCKDPDTDRGGLSFNLPFQLNLYTSRTSITAHTPKMLRYRVDGVGESIQLQTDMFVCPDDATWEQFQALEQAAISASNDLKTYLSHLGTYQEAKHDGRYTSQNADCQSAPRKTPHPRRSESPSLAGTPIAALQPVSRTAAGETDLPDSRPIPPTAGELATYGDRVRTRMNCFGEIREATGVIVAIETNGSHGKVCLFPDVMPYQLGFEYVCPLPPIEQIHPLYHAAYPKDGIHRGTTTVFKTNILEILPPEPKAEPVDKQTSIQADPVLGVEAEDLSPPALPTDEELQSLLVPNDPKQTIAQLLDHVGFALFTDEYHDETLVYRDWQIWLCIPNGGLVGIDIATPDGEWWVIPTEEAFDYHQDDEAIEWAKQVVDRCLQAAELASGQLTLLSSTLEVEASNIAVGDFVELYRSENGEALPEHQRRRAEVVVVYNQKELKVRYRGERWASGKDQSQRFRKLPQREPLPYLTQPVKSPSEGDAVVVTAPDHPCYGDRFIVDATSIFGDFRADGEFFYDEELGYLVEAPIPPEPAQTPDLMQRRSQLLDQVHEIRMTGEVAPKCCSIEPYRVYKKLANGDRKAFNYQRLKADKPIFQGEDGKLKRSLHLGNEEDARYKDWCQRIDRRRAIAKLETELDKIERSLQAH